MDFGDLEVQTAIAIIVEPDVNHVSVVTDADASGSILFGNAQAVEVEFKAQPVLATRPVAIKILDDVQATLIKDSVGTEAGVDRVDSETAVEQIVAGTTDQRVIAAAAAENVIAAGAVECVGIVIAVEMVMLPRKSHST